MIRIDVEVGNEGNALRVAVRAQSIRHALEMARDLFPGSELRVPFPLDPDRFFARDGAAASLVDRGGFERAAG